MLIHQSTTRRKACTCCVKAKRRCDLVLPRCARCTTKGFTCRYVEKGEPTKERRRTKAAIAISVPERTSPPVDPDLNSVLYHEESFDTRKAADDWSKTESMLYNPISFDPFSFPQLCAVDAEHMNYCVMRLRDCVDSLVLENRTMFIHPLSYEDTMPAAYQDVLGVCSLYRAKTARNQSQTFKMLDIKLEALIEASKTETWIVNDVMLALQALLLYQIVRLFDGDKRQLVNAQHHFKLLGAWTSRLQQGYSEAEQTSLLRTPYEQWILLESIRRTILTSVLLRGVYGALNTGICDQVALLGVLPVSSHGGMWKMKEEHWWEEMSSGRGFLRQYRDFVGEWNEGKVAEVEDYEKCLLVACPYALGTMVYMSSPEA